MLFGFCYVIYRICVHANSTTIGYWLSNVCHQTMKFAPKRANDTRDWSYLWQRCHYFHNIYASLHLYTKCCLHGTKKNWKSFYSLSLCVILDFWVMLQSWNALIYRFGFCVCVMYHNRQLIQLDWCIRYCNILMMLLKQLELMSHLVWCNLCL